MDTFKHLNKYVLIVILRRLSIGNTRKTVEALYAGGIRSVEITADSDGVFQLIREIKSKYQDMKIGVGTVLSKEMAEQAIDSGADFILSPVVDIDIIRLVVEKGCIMIPGALTPSEIYKSYCEGAQIIKIFPAGLVGPEYLKSLAAPFPKIPLAPTGGIDETNLKDYLLVSPCCIGISSAIPTHYDNIDSVAYQEIMDKAKKLRLIVKTYQER